MSEYLKPFGKIADRINKFARFMFTESEKSQDVEAFMALGNIERLVKEGRTPLKIGQIGTGYNRMQPYYQIPPVGFNPNDIREVYNSMGVYVFVNKLGVQKIGPTFALSEEQAGEVEKRIKEEMDRLK